MCSNIPPWLKIIFDFYQLLQQVECVVYYFSHKFLFYVNFPILSKWSVDNGISQCTSVDGSTLLSFAMIYLLAMSYNWEKSNEDMEEKEEYALIEKVGPLNYDLQTKGICVLANEINWFTSKTSRCSCCNKISVSCEWEV